jgi:hypothetical protein
MKDKSNGPYKIHPFNDNPSTEDGNETSSLGNVQPTSAFILLLLVGLEACQLLRLSAPICYWRENIKQSSYKN